MSEENVELVLGLYPAPDVDLVQLFRDDRIECRSAMRNPSRVSDRM